MAGSAMWVAQEGMYSILSADASLQSLLGGSVGSPRIFDSVPDNQDFPYAAFGPFNETPLDTFAKFNKELRATVYVFSKYAGNKEASQAVDRMAALLDGAALSITGYTNIRCRHMRSAVTAFGDPVHGIIRRGECEVQILATQV